MITRLRKYGTPVTISCHAEDHVRMSDVATVRRSGWWVGSLPVVVLV